MAQGDPPPSRLGPGAPPGVVHDGVEPMCNGQHRAGLELGADGSLDEVVRLQVNGGRGLVQNEDSALAEEGSGQAHELPLTHAEKGEGRHLQLGPPTCPGPSLSQLFLCPLLPNGPGLAFHLSSSMSPQPCPAGMGAESSRGRDTEG